MSLGTPNDRRWAGPAPQNPVQGALTVCPALQKGHASCGPAGPRQAQGALAEEPLHTTQAGRREADQGAGVLGGASEEK